MKGYGFMTDGQGGPDSPVKVKSYLVAYDMNAGKQLYRVPFGSSLRSEAAGFKNTGLEKQKRTISLTESGLLFSVTDDKKFRATSAEDGKTLLEKEMSGIGSGVPAIYQVNGKQYVLIAVGSSGGFGATPQPGSYIAYTLPDGVR